MAYPMMPLPHYDDFILQLISAGVSVRKSAYSVINADGSLRQLTFLHHEVDGRPLYVALEFAREDEIIQIDVIRSVCRALQLEPALFGLTLG